jgi:hypothetical protein
MKIRKVMKRFELMLIGATLATSALWAQGQNATIQGTITDASGGAVVGAKVDVKNTGTGITQTATSDAQGRYSVPQLPIGDYEVQASQAGFQTAIRRGITLSVGNELVVDFSLQVGQQQQTVEVQGEVSQVETTSSTVSSLVDQTQMRELPLNGRNFEQLILLAPGVQQYTGMSANSSWWGKAYTYSFSGSRPEGQALLLDNQDMQNFWGHGTGSATLGTSLGIDAIAEFQTLTATYSAQYGGAGAVMNSVTKSGTNAFHGSAFEFIRNSDLDSRNFFDPSKLPAFRRNQFGGTVGGPIKKDKAFFFVNYEGLWQSLGETKVANVPDNNARQGYLPCAAAAGFSCNSATNLAYVGLGPDVAATMALYPAPPTNNPVTGIVPISQTGSQPAHENYVLGRFDYTFSDKDSFFARYLSDRVQLTEPFPSSPIAKWLESDNTRNQYGTIEEHHIFSGTMVNAFRVSLSRPVEQGTSVQTNAALQFYPGSGRQDGTVAVGGLSSIGPSSTTPYNYPATKYGEGDDVVWTHGPHSIKFGVAILRDDSNTLNFFRVGSAWTFNSLALFMQGISANVAGNAPPSLGQLYGNRDMRETQIAPYIHDEWKITPKLTLNIGVRYEYATNPTMAQNELWEIVNPPQSPVGCNLSIPTSCFNLVKHVFQNGNPTDKNFDPRVGVAWDPFADHKTSVRAGFGLFHNLLDYHSYMPSLWSSGVSANLVQTFATYPVPFSTIGGSPLQDSPAFNYNTNTTPYMMQWNLTVQREVAANTILNIGYVGSHGVHLMTPIDENYAIPTIDANGVYHFGTLVNGKVVGNTRINPLYSYLYDDKAIGLSQYAALQVALNRRFTTNATVQLSYTWSHCIDIGSAFTGGEGGNNGFNQNPLNMNEGDKGRCSFDIAQALRVNGLYTLPFKGNAFVTGWQLSGIESVSTGPPISPTMGFDNMGDLGGATPRPNVVPGCTDLVLGAPTRWFNPACYSEPTPGTPGNSGRTNVPGPGLVNTDFSILKDTRIPKISEAFDIQFRAEFFNILNHANFSLPTATVFTQTSTGGVNVATTAGQITSTVGTSRQLQFGVKILF